jgi:hypothetical protein
MVHVLYFMLIVHVNAQRLKGVLDPHNKHVKYMWMYMWSTCDALHHVLDKTRISACGTRVLAMCHNVPHVPNPHMNHMTRSNEVSVVEMCPVQSVFKVILRVDGLTS